MGENKGLRQGREGVLYKSEKGGGRIKKGKQRKKSK